MRGCVGACMRAPMAHCAVTERAWGKGAGTGLTYSDGHCDGYRECVWDEMWRAGSVKVAFEMGICQPTDRGASLDLPLSWHSSRPPNRKPTTNEPISIRSAAARQPPSQTGQKSSSSSSPSSSSSTHLIADTYNGDSIHLSSRLP